MFPRHPQRQLRDRIAIDAWRTPRDSRRPGEALGRDLTVGGPDIEVAAVVTGLCRTVAAEADFAGTVVTIVSPTGAPAVLAASDEVARARQEIQFSVGEGPAQDAHAAGHPVVVPDLLDEAGRWPAYVAAAAATGVCAVFAFPLQLGALRVGVFSCYADHPRTLSRTDLAALLDRAGEMTELLLNVNDPDPAAAGRALAGAVHLRNEVYQAQGIVTEQLDVGLAEALSRLRAHAFAAGTDLDALAIDIVAGRVRLPDDRPPTTDHDPR